MGLVSAYDNIIHVAAVEGGAVIVEERPSDGQPVEFLQDFISNAIRPAYVFLAILGLQEYCKLLKMVEGTTLRVGLEAATSKDLDDLASGFPPDNRLEFTHH